MQRIFEVCNTCDINTISAILFYREDLVVSMIDCLSCIMPYLTSDTINTQVCYHMYCVSVLLYTLIDINRSAQCYGYLVF